MMDVCKPFLIFLLAYYWYLYLDEHAPNAPSLFFFFFFFFGGAVECITVNIVVLTHKHGRQGISPRRGRKTPNHPEEMRLRTLSQKRCGTQSGISRS